MDSSDPANARYTFPRSPTSESRPPSTSISRSIPTPDASPSQSDISNADNTPDMRCSSPTPLERREDDSSIRGLTPVHDDLRTWLEHTGFWDAEYRRSILADVRRLRGLEAERAKVLVRIRDSKPPDTADAQSPARLPVAASSSRSDEATVSCHPTSTSTSSVSMAATPRADTTTGPARKQMPLRPIAKKDTRYFLVKSSTMTNVIQSQQDNLWITQAKNGPLLTQAFRECKAVMLFFSVNKSKAFQGYAQMTSLPDPTIPHPPWIAATATEMHTTHPFHIHWITTTETPFRKLSHLKNAFNEHLAVSFGRDGQEYPEDCGRRMLLVMGAVGPAAAAAAGVEKKTYRAGCASAGAATELERSRWGGRKGAVGVGVGLGMGGGDLLVDYEV
ncbi:hypothetical protein E4U21_003703 [Claviceps maximensis]|nr:hypothetical protein E4U21_003703 [Claviceps maximensis]